MGLIMKETVYYCDRCGKALQNGYNKYIFEHKHSVMFCNKWENYWSENYDLCKDCAEDLKKWLKMKN